jgi:hypothetical protein
MTPFTPITSPIEAEFFSIYTRGGIKYIHLWGYTYESSSNEFITEDNPDGIYWANMEACGLEIPLAEFLEESKGYESIQDYTNELYEQCTQYQGDYDAEGMAVTINHYYNDIVFSVDYPSRNEGNPDAILDYSEVTMDTPDGDYIIY